MWVPVACCNVVTYILNVNKDCTKHCAVIAAYRFISLRLNDCVRVFDFGWLLDSFGTVSIKLDNQLQSQRSAGILNRFTVVLLSE
jgi:hypothetical protein